MLNMFKHHLLTIYITHHPVDQRGNQLAVNCFLIYCKQSKEINKLQILCIILLFKKSLTTSFCRFSSSQEQIMNLNSYSRQEDFVEADYRKVYCVFHCKLNHNFDESVARASLSRFLK